MTFRVRLTVSYFFAVSVHKELKFLIYYEIYVFPKRTVQGLEVLELGPESHPLHEFFLQQFLGFQPLKMVFVPVVQGNHSEMNKQ
jgi:hypothetical protein